METISKTPRLLLIIDHISAGSNERFHDLYHACVESIEQLPNVALQLRTKLTESARETALIEPLIEYHQANHRERPLHVNALSAELDEDFHSHLCRARWQASHHKCPRRFSASLDTTDELQSLLQDNRPQFLVVGPVGIPRSKSRQPITSDMLTQLRSFGIPLIGVGGVSAEGVSDGGIPTCDGYAILTPVLKAIDAPANWHRELQRWKPFLNGETT